MWGLISVIIIQRLVELNIAKKNEKWMKERGGIERGQSHYKWFIILHVLFFISLLLESMMRDVTHVTLNYFLFAVFILTQLIRIWCIRTLGKFWNTKIIISPNFSLVSEGPYKFVKHPNYIIVGIELIVIPLLFGAYITAVVFPILHVLLLTIRIPSEEKALAEVKFSRERNENH
ncbi:isoprenylcysteine carboxylmethyltransferase family protein [Virgibacillus sp. C22-A2]|uniref:Isoprenylcysteine carboxylmethyltransferase family protein n=2 Tax=Virgibacillus tibetensis TaxID=3042313 RepID=A0ABU6KDC8_9BACI|nr:isoprenylcysteine carboxylmethyltransferase family protein [Virgibacillus sp. C22-A2]